MWKICRYFSYRPIFLLLFEGTFALKQNNVSQLVNGVTISLQKNIPGNPEIALNLMFLKNKISVAGREKKFERTNDRLVKRTYLTRIVVRESSLNVLLKDIYNAGQKLLRKTRKNGVVHEATSN